MAGGLEQVGARSSRGRSAWRRLGKWLDSVTVTQLLVLLVLAACLYWLAVATRKPVHKPYSLDLNAGKDEKKQLVLEPCALAEGPDFEETWKWCQSSHYKACRSNYAADLKRKDFHTLLDTVARAFDRYNVRWWLDFSTLQGVGASGELLPWEHTLSIGVLEEDFAKFYEKVLSRIHDCDDEAKPVFWNVRSDRSLKGMFQLKRQPHFWMDVSPWKAGEGDVLEKAGWKRNSNHPEVVDIPRKLVLPLHPVKLLGVQCFMPADAAAVLDLRYGDQWRTPVPPPFYRPDLPWGSDEMRKL